MPQFGNKVGEGQFRGKTLPTYVYPQCLKMAVREKIANDLKEYPDPEGAAVRTSHVYLDVNFPYVSTCNWFSVF